MLKTQPTVIEKSFGEEAAQIELLVDADLIYFDGHFDGFPILPGVTLVSWASSFAKDSFLISESRGLDNLKFLKPVLPGMKLKLELKYRKEKSCVEFGYSEGTEKIASGRILVGEP